MRPRRYDLSDAAADYDVLVDQFGELGPRIEELLRFLIQEEGIGLHSVVYRVKAKDSALSKLTSKPDRYSSLHEMTDLLGLRVITFFADHVDKVSDCIAREFRIDAYNSVDKREILDADRFGYLSMHYVASIGSKRQDLQEYRRFKSLKFEIQVRSILQHAWAEIEHDLGYKSDDGLPREMRRRFSRLAGLLEIGDSEFSALRLERDRYEAEVRRDIAENTSEIPLDQASLSIAIEQVPIFGELDQLIVARLGATLRKVDRTYLSRRVTALRSLGVDTVSQLVNIAKQSVTDIDEFVAVWLTIRDKTPSGREVFVPPGIGLFYLEYVLAAKNPAIRGEWARKRKPGLMQRVDDAWASIRPPRLQ